jgi:outer membrane lipoprotein-sorting protein
MKKLFILLPLLIAVAAAVAEEEKTLTADQVLEKFEAAQAKLSDFSADLVQVTSTKDNKELEKV